MRSRQYKGNFTCTPTRRCEQIADFGGFFGIFSAESFAITRSWPVRGIRSCSSDSLYNYNMQLGPISQPIQYDIVANTNS